MSITEPRALVVLRLLLVNKALAGSWRDPPALTLVLGLELGVLELGDLELVLTLVLEVLRTGTTAGTGVGKGLTFLEVRVPVTFYFLTKGIVVILFFLKN